MDLEKYAVLSNEELVKRILKRKDEINAILLVHNYQRMEIQELADFRGDSLELARKAQKTDAGTIVFCGVDFMAESAKILSPEKMVLLPDANATCPMAQMIDPGSLIKMKKKHPGAVVITYVNSTADVKAESDICCTSANAVNIVNHYIDKKIIFTPDENLANYCISQTGADIIPWKGFCYVHDNFSAKHVKERLDDIPGAKLIAHPECKKAVLELADHVTSTSGMVKVVKDNLFGETPQVFATEVGLVERLKKEFPGKKLYPIRKKGICRTMKLTTLPKLAWAMDNLQYQIEIPPNVRIRAKEALQKMIDMSSPPK